MKPSLGLRTSQHLALTPQLQQSIKLLQMSTAELEQEIEKFLNDNPLLETAETPSADVSLEGLSRTDLSRTDLSRTDSSAESTNETSSSEEFERESEMGSEALAGSAESWAGGSGRSDRNDDEGDWEPQRAQPVSLRDHLHEQALGLSLSERDMAWLEVLIESLDEDGYLRDSLQELADSVTDAFLERFGEALQEDELLSGLKLLQSMDPAGVGARGLQECLSLQLARCEISDERSLAKKIIENAALLEALGAREFNDLCKKLQCDRDALRDGVALIQSLNPKPGAGFADDAAESVIPDVIAYRSAVTVQGGAKGRKEWRWQVRLNESAVPRLSINPVYAEVIRQERGSGMASQLQEARWVSKNIQQRFDTILRVAQAIAAEQQAFFEQGELAMKPMVLREIAQACDLHESTVSRVTTNKFMLTPKGTFELKYFFTSHVGTEDGGTASSTAIRAKIKQWIGEEDPRKPLSDQQIADRFGNEGIQVARRTIAKYREALRIEPVSQRKKL